MNGDPLDPEHASPAEERLGEHLALLRNSPPRYEPALVPSVLRAARWQRAVRGPLIALGRLTIALTSSIRGLFPDRGPRRP